MKDKDTKYLKKYNIFIIISILLFVVSVVIINNTKNEVLEKIFGSITVSILVSISFTIAFHFNIEKLNIIVSKSFNHYNEVIYNQEKKINQLINQIELIKYETVTIYMSKQQNENLTNPDDELFVEMKRIFDPIEEFYVNNGGFGAPFINSIFIKMQSFAQKCTMSRYMFTDSKLKAIHEKIKIIANELTNILQIYTFPLDSNSGLSKFEYLEISKWKDVYPDRYSITKVKENEEKFYLANNLLDDLVKNYRDLVETYNNIKFN